MNFKKILIKTSVLGMLASCSSYQSISPSSNRTIAAEKQCIHGFCVGDKVIPDDVDGGSAPVLAIDVEKNKCVLNQSWLGTSAYYTECDRLSAMKGCLNDICVGDKVIPYNVRSGSAPVKGINFAKAHYTVNKMWLGTKWLRYSADELTVIKKK